MKRNNLVTSLLIIRIIVYMLSLIGSAFLLIALPFLCGISFPMLVGLSALYGGLSRDLYGWLFK